MEKVIEITASLRDAQKVYERLVDAGLLKTSLVQTSTNSYESESFDLDDDELDDMEDLEDDINSVLDGLEYDIEEKEQ